MRWNVVTNLSVRQRWESYCMKWWLVVGKISCICCYDSGYRKSFQLPWNCITLQISKRPDRDCFSSGSWNRPGSHRGCWSTFTVERWRAPWPAGQECGVPAAQLPNDTCLQADGSGQLNPPPTDWEPASISELWPPSAPRWTSTHRNCSSDWHTCTTTVQHGNTGKASYIFILLFCFFFYCICVYFNYVFYLLYFPQLLLATTSTKLKGKAINNSIVHEYSDN